MTSRLELDAVAPELTTALDAEPWPLHPAVESIAIHLYVYVNEHGQPRLGLFGILPGRKRYRRALLLHLAEAIRAELAGY